jgi:hypothetical protein
MTTRLHTPKDSLDTAAKAHILRLLAEQEAATQEFDAIERERKRRQLLSGASFHDLHERHERAVRQYDAAVFALELGLGTHPNKAAEQTLTAIREQVWREQRVTPSATREARWPANVIPFRRPTGGFEPSPEQLQRGYITPDELAGAVSVSRNTVDKYLKAGKVEDAYKTTNTNAGHWRIPLDAPDRLKRQLSRREN